jgi:hypothetical protein
MNNINIKVIPESEQRKEVNGADWWWDENMDLQVRVSPMSDWRYEALLAMHEAIEAILCRHNGVNEPDVCRFDQEFDKTHTFDVDAGDEPDAPYVREHCFATGLERVMCAELDVNWKTYDAELASTYPGPSKKSK